MSRISTLRNRICAAAILSLLLFSAPRPAHAVSKEIIELQIQVQQLTDMVQRLQSTIDSRFGVLQHLVEQSADNVNQMNSSVAALQKKINSDSEGNNGKIDTVSGQVQSLNDSVDELKSRIAKLDKAIQDMQAQMQNAPAPSSGGMASAGPTPGNSAPPDNSTAQAPPLQASYQSAVRDYNAAKYEVAMGEFQDILHYYPNDDLAGGAQFYLGEIAYRQQNYNDAIKSYNAILEGFPGNAKAPAAQLHKGYALLQQNKKDAGVRELRLLIQRHPQTPEATQARSKLNEMGIRITPAVTK